MWWKEQLGTNFVFLLHERNIPKHMRKKIQSPSILVSSWNNQFICLFPQLGYNLLIFKYMLLLFQCRYKWPLFTYLKNLLNISRIWYSYSIFEIEIDNRSCFQIFFIRNIMLLQQSNSIFLELKFVDSKRSVNKLG
jgi:hypothetical protein